MGRGAGGDRMTVGEIVSICTLKLRLAKRLSGENLEP